MHLIVDGHTERKDLLQGEAEVYFFLLAIATSIGMTPVAGPFTHSFRGGGVTGVLVVAESHVSMHTWPESGLIFLDVFSCKDFDGSGLIEMIKRAAEMGETQILALSRGVDEGVPPMMIRHAIL